PVCLLTAPQQYRYRRANPAFYPAARRNTSYASPWHPNQAPVSAAPQSRGRAWNAGGLALSPCSPTGAQS
ncbi:hypothetical protein NHX12_000518, partial [Muraenolepis orangiensis]